MPNIEAEEHLKIAKRLHFQGQIDEAAAEYERVLELDPQNKQAISALESLGVDSPFLREKLVDTRPQNGELKTSFFVNQAKSGHSSALKSGFLRLTILVLTIGTIYGIYILVNYVLDYDNIAACRNVDIVFEKPQLDKNGNGSINVVVTNLNPAPIQKLIVSYRIADNHDTTLSESVLKLPGSIPAGDRRTFSDISLGTIKGIPAKLSPKLSSLIYGPKPKIKDKYVDRFMKAAAMNDKDALYEYEDLVQDVESFAPAYVGLGRALAARGKFDDAISQYKKAAELDPNNANAHYYAAVALFYKNDHGAAKKEIELAQQMAPEDPEIAWNQKYLFAMKESKEAKSKKSDKQQTTTKNK